MSDSDHSEYSSASSSGGNDAPNTDSVSSFLPHAKGSGTLSGDAHDAAFLQAAASHPSAESRSAAMFQTKWFGMRYVSEDSELHYCLYRYNDRRRNLFVLGMIYSIGMVFVSIFSDPDFHAPIVYVADFA
jgi:hypothetical protein